MGQFTDELVEYYTDLVSKISNDFNEDGLAEDDWAGWVKLTAKLGIKYNLLEMIYSCLTQKNFSKFIKQLQALLIKVN